jgi:RND family efflux transporter MFP subunit
MKNQTIPLVVLLLILTIFGCKESKVEEPINKKKYLQDKNQVSINVLKKTPFKKELVSNGVLVALEKSDLKFKVTEKLAQIFVANGDIVKKGQLLATLNDFSFRQKLNKAKLDLKEATLGLNDLKARRNFNDSIVGKNNIDEIEMIEIKSGYKKALYQLENARFDFESTKLIAPFGGKIANVTYKKHDQVGSGSKFLTLINDSVFEVEFYIIESELADIKKKSSVVVKPFASNKTYTGIITSINPKVEKHGTILVKASVKNDGSLLEGMNVKIFIEKDIPNQFVVPKSAVVLRDNQEVLFKVVNGRAYWNYILTTYENSQHYAVVPNPDKSSASLQVGDTIIVSDNLNLAHDSEIKIKDLK